MSVTLRLFSLCVVVLIAGCAGSPPSPDWEIDADKAMKRGMNAYLEGNQRVEAAEFALANREVARTGRPDLVARVALSRCAAEVASLEFRDCPGFERVREDNFPPERAYADYLLGRPVDAALVPPQHRAVAPANGDKAAADAVKAISDPVARLIAAGVVFRRNQASPMLIETAIETASQQGWRKPLLAWLRVQQKRAELAKDDVAVNAIKRRIALVESSASATPAPQPTAPAK
jgi:hypothetical protein